jgi:cyclic pyranopterin monophosphate synthase
MATERTGLSHIDEHGKAHMVDVNAKPITVRRAVARCVVRTNAPRAQLDEPWLIACIRVSGVQAAKAASSLIPLCHPLPIGRVNLEVACSDGLVEIVATTEVLAKTGVEMEALCACGIAALSVITALAHTDPDAYVDELTLWHKSGGRSGTYERAIQPAGDNPDRGITQ